MALLLLSAHHFIDAVVYFETWSASYVPRFAAVLHINACPQSCLLSNGTVCLSVCRPRSLPSDSEEGRELDAREEATGHFFKYLMIPLRGSCCLSKQQAKQPDTRSMLYILSIFPLALSWAYKQTSIGRISDQQLASCDSLKISFWVTFPDKCLEIDPSKVISLSCHGSHFDPEFDAPIVCRAMSSDRRQTTTNVRRYIYANF